MVATRANRDAIGSIVRFKVGQEQRSLWVLSGDGYFCSNEKTLIAGLADTEIVTEVTVHWADGSSESFGDLPADHCYLLRQGSGAAFELSSY